MTTHIFQPDRELLSNTVKEMSSLVEGTILDIGAGDFDRYGSFFSKADRVIKLDIKSSKNINIVGSATALPFPNNYFDGIVSMQAWEFLDPPQQAINECFRTLNNNGTLMITAPFFAEELHEFDLYRYSKNGLEQMMKNAGFEIIASQSVGGFYTTIVQMIIRFMILHLDLHHSILGKLFKVPIMLLGRTAMFLDRRSNHNINKKFALNACVTGKKN